MGTSSCLLGTVRALEADQLLSYNAGRFLIQPQLDLSSQFTGNLFYASTDPQPGGLTEVYVQSVDGNIVPVIVAAPQGSEIESDLLWYVSPGLEIQYGPNPENSLTLSYFHDQIFYTQNSDFNAGQDRLQFDARAQFRRFTLKGTDNVAWLDTILGGSTAVARRVPVRRLVWSDDYRLTYDATMKTDFYVGFRHDLSDYLQSINLYDQGTIAGLVGATYKPSERIGIFVEGGGGHTDVTANLPPPPPTPVPPGYPLPPYQTPGNDSFVYGGFVGVRGSFSARIDGSIKVGYETRTFPDVEDAANGGSPAVSVSLNYTPNVRRFINLTFDRRVGVSSQVANQSYTYNTFNLTVTQMIGSSGRWMVRGLAAFSLNDFDSATRTGTAVSAGGPVDFIIDNARTDQTYTASLGLVYQPKAWLTSSLTYNFERYSANFADEYVAITSGLNDFFVNRVILQISIGY